MNRPDLKRRALLKQLGLAGGAFALQPRVVFAAAPSDARLVVLILRGAMDGLDVLQPVADRNYLAARPRLRSPSKPLTDFYALNDALDGLRPLWDVGELAFAQAVATPYRDKRSHFDGQDMLEAGTGMDVEVNAVRDGWLNRFLQVMPGATAETAYAIGSAEMKVLAGKAPTAVWSPRTNMAINAPTQRLIERIYMDDPLFHAAAMQAIDLAQSTDGGGGSMESGGDQSQASRADRALAAFAADRLNGDARIAAFSLNGWDTHRQQTYPLQVALGRLADTLLTLKAGLGPNWRRTAVLVMTEFGRSVRENGNRGTDHGTGGMMLIAGGAIKGRTVYGGWPGLAESDLYARRDLMPTADVRSYAAWALADMYGAERSTLERKIFPGLELGPNPGFVR